MIISRRVPEGWTAIGTAIRAAEAQGLVWDNIVARKNSPDDLSVQYARRRRGLGRDVADRSGATKAIVGS